MGGNYISLSKVVKKVCRKINRHTYSKEISIYLKGNWGVLIIRFFRKPNAFLAKFSTPEFFSLPHVYISVFSLATPLIPQKKIGFTPNQAEFANRSSKPTLSWDSNELSRDTVYFSNWIWHPMKQIQEKILGIIIPPHLPFAVSKLYFRHT